MLTPLIASAPTAAGSQPFARVQAAPRTLSGARATGAMSARASLSGSVVLKPRDGAALQSFITAVSTPGSSRFHDYLPAGAFAKRFGPTRATIAAVRKIGRAHV